MKIKQALIYSAFALLTYFAQGCTDERCKGTPVNDIPSVDARGSMAEYRKVCKELNQNNLNYRLEAKQTDDGIDLSLFVNGENPSTEPVHIRYITCLTEGPNGWKSSCMAITTRHYIKGPFIKGKTIEDKANLPSPRFDKDTDEAYVLPQAMLYSDSKLVNKIGEVGTVFPAKLKK